MKKTALLISLILLFTTVCSVASLASGTKPEDFPEFYDAKEYPEIEQALLGWHTGSVKVDFAYKVYHYADVSTSKFIDDLAAGKDPSGNLKDKYNWVAISKNSTFTIVQDSGKWSTAGQRSRSSETKPSQDISREAFDHALGGIEAASVKAFRITQIFTTFLLIRTQDAAYVVPFCARPDFTYLENGKRYTLEEAGAILRTTDYYTHPLEPGQNGGGGTSDIPVWYFIAGGVLLALITAAVVVVILKKRKK